MHEADDDSSVSCATELQHREAFPVAQGEKGAPSPRPAFGSCHFLDVSPWANHFTSVRFHFPHL